MEISGSSEETYIVFDLAPLLINSLHAPQQIVQIYYSKHRPKLTEHAQWGIVCPCFMDISAAGRQIGVRGMTIETTAWEHHLLVWAREGLVSPALEDKVAVDTQILTFAYDYCKVVVRANSRTFAMA